MKNDHIGRAAMIAGARTPFVKSREELRDIGPLDLARHVVEGLIDRHVENPECIDAIAFRVTLPEPGRPKSGP